MGNKVLRKQVPTLAYCVYCVDLSQVAYSCLNKTNSTIEWPLMNGVVQKVGLKLTVYSSVT